jgi:hypothetical protein
MFHLSGRDFMNSEVRPQSVSRFFEKMQIKSCGVSGTRITIGKGPPEEA